jgi:hypothetical protein
VFAELLVMDGKPSQHYDENIVPSRHRVSIPIPFLKRALEHHQQYYGNHLWNVVKKSLQQDQ